MHISVNILSGGEPKREVIPLEVIPDDRVENVKAKIEQIVQSLPSYQQLLLYSGQQLEDGSSLEEYGVEDNSTILLVFKPNGMLVMVKKVDSESSFMNIAVESTSSIADVKQCIDRMQRGKLSPEINLYFNGKLLKDNSTLSDKGVVPLSTLEFAEVLCLHIWLSSGETTSIHVLTSDEIGDVKNRIMRMEHLRRGHYALKFSGQRLEETKRISDYDIPYGSTLLLQEVFRYRGAGGTEVAIMLVLGIIFAILCCPCAVALFVHDRWRHHHQVSRQTQRPADENSLEEKLSSAPTQPTEEPTSVSVSTMEEPRLSNLTPPTKQPPTPVKEIDVIDIPIEVRLPTGSSITVTALNTDNIHNFKSKIEAVEPSYPSSHQRLVKPGRCDDILDEDELHQHIKYFCRDRFVLRGKLISINVRKHDGLPGFLILFLEYFDTVRRIKEEVCLDKNMKVPPSQQQILYEGSLLDDSLTLSQCGIEDGSQVAVRVLAPSCQQLMSELLKDSVACRYEQFAVHLGLSPDTVAVITMNHRDAHRCLINILNHWVNNFEVSWSRVTTALDNIDCRNMAETIRMKYS